MNQPRELSSASAFRFVLMIGFANLFADMTYEGARSVTGAFLATLGANAAMVGFTAGLGELVGFALRSVTGYLSDKTGRYWLMTITGYVVNMLAVPALALAGNWPLAAGLIVAERTGRAIRKPSTAAMLSFAGRHLGSGWVFGLNEALDQAGATIGPLVVAGAFLLKGDFRSGFAVLAVSAVLTIAIVAAARWFFPRPHDLEAGHPIQLSGSPKAFWLYLFGGACIAAGFADFALIAYHFKKTGSVTPTLIPIFYSAAMATGALGGLVFGRLYDRVGVRVLIAAFVLSSLFSPFVFRGNAWLGLVGMILWGLGMGAQESLLKAVIAGITPADRRGTAFGVFDTGFGLAWFAGSWAMGLLYEHSLDAVIVLSVVLQLASLPFFLLAGKERQR